MNCRIVIPVAIGMSILGCAGESEEDSGFSDAAPEDIVEYYEVTGSGLWQGSYPYETHMVALRVLQPSTSTIFEHFIGLGEEAGESYEGTAQVDLETQAFTMTLTYPDGSYEGTGVLYGDAWDWHSWESETIGTDGTRVVSEDTKDDSGIIANKTGYDVDGEEEWTMEEVLTPITEEEWLTLQEDLE